MRRLASMVGVSLALLGLGGCLTSAVHATWVDSSGDATLGLRARRVGTSKLEILWRERSSGGLWSSGVASLEPGIERCDAIEVLADDAGGLQALDERQERVFSGSAEGARRFDGAWSQLAYPDCTVLLVVGGPGVFGPFHTLRASTRQRELGTATIPAMRNPLWLALFPPALVVDAATLPLWSCLLASPENLCLQLLDETY